jgi:hypothetical protein
MKYPPRGVHAGEIAAREIVLTEIVLRCHFIRWVEDRQTDSARTPQTE